MELTGVELTIVELTGASGFASRLVLCSSVSVLVDRATGVILLGSVVSFPLIILALGLVFNT